MRAALEQQRVTSRRDRHAVSDAHRDLRGPAARGARRQSATRSRRPTSATASARRDACAVRCTASRSRVKDNIHTTDMPTTGGALAFDGFVPPYEATLVGEPAGGRRDHHREDRHDRARQLGGRRADADADQLQRGRRLRLQPVRSAARSAAATRDGRPRCRPAARARASARRRISGRRMSAPRRPGRFSARRIRTCSSGIKPTVGRVSRYGVIPITADQDTPGPMAKIGDGRGDHARRARGRGARSARSGDEALHAAARTRLHARSCDADALQGRAHRHPARVTSTTARSCRAAASRGRSLARAGRVRWPKRSASCASRARSSSIPPTSRASSIRIPSSNFAAVERLFGAEDARGQ